MRGRPLFVHEDSRYNVPILVSVIVDDFLAASRSNSLTDQLFNVLSKKYRVKLKGETKLFLNWKISRNDNGDIHVSQPHVISQILTKLNMSECNPRKGPYLEKSLSDSPPAADPLSPQMLTLYQRTLGDLRYLADSTRPDTYLCVKKLAQAMQAPSAEPWTRLNICSDI